MKNSFLLRWVNLHKVIHGSTELGLQKHLTRSHMFLHVDVVKLSMAGELFQEVLNDNKV